MANLGVELTVTTAFKLQDSSSCQCAMVLVTQTRACKVARDKFSKLPQCFVCAGISGSDECRFSGALSIMNRYIGACLQLGNLQEAGRSIQPRRTILSYSTFLQKMIRISQLFSIGILPPRLLNVKWCALGLGESPQNLTSCGALDG